VIVHDCGATMSDDHEQTSAADDNSSHKNPTTTAAPLSCPALFISAPASGQGKTTITASLARLLHRNGKTVRIFKFGPDYLDPQILERGSNTPVVQLDLWMAGEEWCRLELFRAVSEGKADIILIEGAMGLFDGTPSSADLAAKFGIPVVLIMNIAAMAQTAAAIAVGLRNYRDDFDMIGVIANYCGSNYHAKLVRDELPDDLPLLAALKRTDAVKLPERHLGLVQPSEIGENFIEQCLEAGADLLEESGILTYIDRLEHISFHPPSQLIDTTPINSKVLTGTTIAIAKDDAFSFTYTANITLLKDMGASICYFSPVHDDLIPLEANALWLPGGYPEVHAKELSENTNMLSSLRSFHKEGNPILAECGGFLYCMETLIDMNDNSWSMAGLMPGVGTMKNKAG
jgi:cobyrinic acid a,c-diamide synthase